MTHRRAAAHAGFYFVVALWFVAAFWLLPIAAEWLIWHLPIE